MPIDVERLQAVAKTLSDVIVEPERWPGILAEISIATSAMGAALIPLKGARGSVVSSNLDDCLEAYLCEGWHDQSRDTRKRTLDLLQQSSVVLDQDLFTGDLARPSPFFDEFLPRFDGKWWAGIGLRSGPELWCLTLHRPPSEIQFDETEKAIFQEFSGRLSEIGNLTYVIGNIAMSETANALDQIRQAALAIDEFGNVICTNSAAEQMFGSAVRCVAGRLLFNDRRAAARYNQFLDRLRWVPDGAALREDPIIVRRENAPPVLIEIVPVDGAARSPFLQARALLLLRSITKPERPDWQLLVKTFELTPAEARLAARLVTGEPLEQIADKLKITKETARYELKSVFQKTDVHRQSELVALLSSFPRST